MNRGLQKAIYTRTKLKNKYWWDPSTENELAYKKQRNLQAKKYNKLLK